MRILLSNDDGFQALGIRVLNERLRARGHETFVVAPNEEKSGNSHAMSFFLPLMVKRIDPTTYSVHGTPADCVALALSDIMKDTKPDLVISGINNGYNVGRDINYSGTVGAATEGALEGHRAIAVSMERMNASNESEFRASLTRVADFVCDLVENIESLDWSGQEVLNINMPSTPHKGVRLAECNSTSLYEPFIDRMNPSGPFTQNIRVYMIGGARRPSFPDNSEDVSLVHQGFAVLSFLRFRQWSSHNTRKLESLAGRLESLRAP
jgi:5'-nucleotidase